MIGASVGHAHRVVVLLGGSAASDFDGDVPSLIKYTDPETGSVLAIPPSGQERSVYMRRIFSINDLSVQTQLKLHVEYQDGFIAYLNGVEVARRGLGIEGTPVTFDTVALRRNKRVGFAKMDISEHLDLLVEGENVLAVEVHRANGRGQLTASVVLK